MTKIIKPIVKRNKEREEKITVQINKSNKWPKLVLTI